jgi:hypothetical protein
MWQNRVPHRRKTVGFVCGGKPYRFEAFIEKKASAFANRTIIRMGPPPNYARRMVTFYK